MPWYTYAFDAEKDIKAWSSVDLLTLAASPSQTLLWVLTYFPWPVSDFGEKWLHHYQWEPVHKEVRCSLDIVSLWVVDRIFMELTSIVLFRVEKNILLLQCLVWNQGSLHWVWWKPQCQPCWISCSSVNDVCCFLCICESFLCHFHLLFYFYSCFLSGIINSIFLTFLFKEVGDSQTVGAPAIDERKNSTNLTMTFPAQLKPELRTRLAR
jgi:hypothetical protein